jgi:hypothetical protein
MSSLIADTEKTEMNAEILNVFDTFKRPITVYSEPEKTIIYTNCNFSRFGDNGQNNCEPINTPLATVIDACILYDKQQRYPYIDASDGQIKIKNAAGRVRIKVAAENYSLMAKAKSFELDGFSFRPYTTARPHGLFTPILYTFFLERTE